MAVKEDSNDDISGADLPLPLDLIVARLVFVQNDINHGFPWLAEEFLNASAEFFRCNVFFVCTDHNFYIWK